MPLTASAFGKRWLGLLSETAKAAVYAAAGRATDEEGRAPHAHMLRSAWGLAELEREYPQLGASLGQLTAGHDPRLAALREAALAWAEAPSPETADAILAAARKHFWRKGGAGAPFAHQPTRRLPAAAR